MRKVVSRISYWGALAVLPAALVLVPKGGCWRWGAVRPD